MILIDYSQVVIACAAEMLKETKKEDDASNLLRHAIFNNIRSLNKKFRNEYGETVICCDGPNSWRKDIFPYYKANRKETRDKSPMDFEMIFRTMREIRQDIEAFFPYRVVMVERAEADDVIATLATRYSDEKILIVSGDKDFVQLQRFPNVRQYDAIRARWIEPDGMIERILFEHIVKGDSTDGITNILSEDDCLVNHVRQKSVMTKKIDEWFKDRETMPNDPETTKRFIRNKMLIDLTFVPKEIQAEVLNNFENQPTKDRSFIMDYFSKHKMRHLLTHIGDF